MRGVRVLASISLRQVRELQIVTKRSPIEERGKEETAETKKEKEKSSSHELNAASKYYPTRPILLPIE